MKKETVDSLVYNADDHNDNHDDSDDDDDDCYDDDDGLSEFNFHKRHTVDVSFKKKYNTWLMISLEKFICLYVMSLGEDFETLTISWMTIRPAFYISHSMHKTAC